MPNTCECGTEIEDGEVQCGGCSAYWAAVDRDIDERDFERDFERDEPETES